MALLVLTMFILGVAVPAAAQTDNVVNPPPPVRSVNLSGPRFGFTSLSQGIVDKLATEHDIVVRTGITQFGDKVLDFAPQLRIGSGLFRFPHRPNDKAKRIKGNARNPPSLSFRA